MKKYLFLLISIVLFFSCEDKQEKDCAWVEGGTAVLDNCEQCVGGDTGETACVEDCNGDFGGTSWESDCGCVSIDNSGDDCDDCSGTPNGTAEILTYWYDADNDGWGTGESSEFFSGTVEAGWVLNNDDEDDNCESNIHDCTGICDGDTELDMCGTCDSNPSNDCIQDCTGIWGGSYTDCSVYDIDGNGYTSVIIGSQEWLVQNLKVTHYKNGDEIPTGYSHSEWANLDEMETGLEYWNSPNTGATNESGFTGLPGGDRSFGSIGG